jgi:hypothetical protein
MGSLFHFIFAGLSVCVCAHQTLFFLFRLVICVSLPFLEITPFFKKKKWFCIFLKVGGFFNSSYPSTKSTNSCQSDLFLKKEEEEVSFWGCPKVKVIF